MRKRLEALKRDEKGFTLVELIVVLVILAILAALLVPALLGYIDRAKNSKYLEEARSIYTAVQAVLDEKYAKGDTAITKMDASNNTSDLDKVNDLVDPTDVSSVEITPATTGEAKHQAFVVDGLKVTFTSQDTHEIYIEYTGGEWVESSMTIDGE